MSQISYIELFKELRRGILAKANLLLLGKEDYLKQEAINKIKKILFKDKTTETLDYVVYYADELPSIDEFIISLKEIPFFAKKKLVVLKRLDTLSFKDKNKLSKYFDNSNDSCCFVILATELACDDPIYIQVSDYGYVVNFPLVKEKEFLEFVLAEFRKYNKNITYNAAVLLYELFQDEGLLAAKNEIEKICLYNINKEKIEPEDIYNLCEGDYIISIYEYIDALIGNDIKKAIFALKKLKRAKIQPNYILFYIINSIREVFWASSILKNIDTSNKEEIIKSIASKLGLSKGRAFYLYKRANLVKKDKMRKYYNLLYRIDKIFKSYDKDIHYNTLEVFTLEVCHDNL